jgi:hypothetical protein
MDSDRVKLLVAKEVSSQLEAIRLDIKKYVKKTVGDLGEEIKSNIIDAVQQYVDGKLDESDKNTTSNALVKVDPAVVKSITKTVYNALDNKFSSEINYLRGHVEYHTQDTTELVTKYRQAVHSESKRMDNKRITTGRGEDKYSWMDGNVGLFFNDE